MKKKTKYTNESLGKIEIITDFLPRPDKLIFKEEMIEIKIPVAIRHMDFYKKQAKKNRVEIPDMIKALIGSYAENHLKH